MNKGRYVFVVSTMLFFVLLVPFLFLAVDAPPIAEYDFADINTSNVDGVADIGTHSDFTAQQIGPDSIYDTLTEQNTGVGEITKVGTDTSGTGTSLTLSFSHTLVSGTARIVIVSIGVENGGTIDVSTVTYGGVTMTPAIEGITGTSGFRYLCEIWYILEDDLPTDGSKTVAITCTGTASSLEINAFCSEYTGLSQGAPEATAEHHQTTGTTITNDISPSDNAWVMSAIGSGNRGSWTHGESQVEVLDFADSSSTFAVAELRGASGETSLSSTFSATVNRLERVAASWAGAIEDNYELDLEVQWTNANCTQAHEELCIFGGSMDSENIQVHVWSGSAWQILFPDLSTGWNNISVSEYLVSPIFTIKFSGGTETGDTFQDSWEIDCTLLHTWGDPPIASFLNIPDNPYTDETVTFNASESYDPDGTIESYTWDFGDGTNGTGETTSHSFTDDGIYTVTLTVTDDDDLQDTISTNITVLNRSPVASFSESATTVLTDSIIDFNASYSYDSDGSIVSYFWIFGDGQNTTGMIAQHAYVDDGTYIVNLTITDDDSATDTTTSTITVINRSPVPSFTKSSETAYTLENLTFNASLSYDPDGSIVSYFWDFGDGLNASGVVVSHAYSDDGVYVVTLTVMDDDGAVDSATATLTILNRLPIASFTESAETVYTAESISFNASLSYDPDGYVANYFWDFGDGMNATGVTVAYGYVDDGVYIVTLSVMDDDGASASVTAVKTVLNRLPVAVFTESASTVQTNEVIDFNASSSYDPDGSIVSYFWDFGDGLNASGVVVSHAYSDDGVYVVTLTVMDDDGAVDSATATKTVLSNSLPIASFTESAETVYTGETIYFDASASYDPDGIIVSYFWDFGDGRNATGVTASVSYMEDGSYTVTLTIMDDQGANNSSSAVKTVLNRLPVAVFTESASTVQTNEVIDFNASSSYDPDGSIVSYFWDFGDGTNTTGILVSHMYSDNGTYTVTLTATDNDGATSSTTATKTVLNRSPVASFVESASTVLTGETITFNASESYDIDGTIVSFFWIFGDGTNSSGIVTSHAYADDGVYTVTLIVTDNDGATASSSATKNVLNRPPIASFTESAETVYTAESISFNASLSYDPDGYVANYFWDFGDGMNATGVTVAYGYVDDGVYIVTLSVMDDDGASASVTAVKTVLNRLPVAVFTESASTVQTNEVIDFNASSSYDPDGSIVSYFWDFGDGLNASGVVVSHAYSDDGVYVVTLTVMDDDGAVDSATATKNALNRAPTASFTESASTVFTGETIYFDASASYDPDGIIVSYFWDFGDETNANGTVVEHSYAIDGLFTVTLTVVDDDGAPDYAQATKTVLPSLSDVGITNIVPSNTETYKGNALNVSVTVLNEGTGSATFNITLYRSEVYGWHLVEIEDQFVWYSGEENLADFLLVTLITVPAENPTLAFETMYNIENLYDFGFVQISTDDGLTWVSLENSYTTYNHEPDTSPEIVTNLPGLTGISEGWPEWKTMTFNLGEYAGQTVLLGFRYMTDIGRFEEGWCINNVTINGGAIFNQAFEQTNPPQLQAIQTLTVDNLAPGSQRSLIFRWNTTDTSKGRYFLSAVADPIAGEIDLLDNSFANGIVEVKSNPDLDGDGDVDIFDVVMIASLYGCKEGEADWNPKADLVEDGEINIFDVVEVAANYGKTLPT